MDSIPHPGSGTRAAFCGAAVALLLVACGDADESGRGELLEPAAEVATLKAAAIDAATAASGLQAFSGAARCDVKLVTLNYATVGAWGEGGANASGVLLLPSGSRASGCGAAAPLVAYAKGTDVRRPRTLANPDDPETFLLVAMYAAQGYAVVASDYLGYAKSRYSFHPYLHADSEATSVIDAVRAARRAAPAVGASLSGKLMFTGYSQGGHASMAAQRAAERDYGNEFQVVAGAHLAGPYNLVGAEQATDAVLGVQFFVPFLVTAWQRVYGNLYSDVTQAFKPPYDGYIETLLPSPTLDDTTLITSGKLPGGPGVTPEQARDLIFHRAFLLAAQTDNHNPLYRAAERNTLFGWTPKAPLLLCGGAGDPTVPPAVHQWPMKADFDRRGATNVSSVDVDALIQAAYGPGGHAPTDPGSAEYATYYGNYHDSYEAPFCHVAARALFDPLR